MTTFLEIAVLLGACGCACEQNAEGVGNLAMNWNPMQEYYYYQFLYDKGHSS